MNLEDFEIGGLYEVMDKRDPGFLYGCRYFIFLGILNDPNRTYHRIANPKLYFIKENEEFFVNYKSHYLVHARKC